tara:strand:- start:495 stop:932 length:438 start_codon:yes stop_codon:yes gene_type:complete
MPSAKHALFHMYSDDESEEEIEEETDHEKIYKQICDLNQEEMNFFEDISSIGAFYRFNIAYPKTDHWNKPRKYNNVRSLFYKSVDEKTLNLICPRNHYDYTGEGTFYLDKDLVDTLFMFAERWCVAHDIKDVFWVASCIIQFSCI